MLDPDFEVRKLHGRLRDRGYVYADADSICRDVSSNIQDAIIDIVSNATGEAVSYAESIGATDFLADIDVMQAGHSFTIRTKSGKTDYSIERVENLPNLLRNGKTAKDGSKYKVVPIKEKPKMGISSFDNMLEQQKTISAARENISANNAAKLSERASMIANRVRQDMIAKKQESQVTSFKTASSKQDAGSQWVIPEINRDMTQFLQQLNDNIAKSINDQIFFIIDKYDREY